VTASGKQAKAADALQGARDVISRHPVWDNHGCMPVARPHDTSFLPQLQRYRASGIDAVTLNIGFGDQTVEQHFRTLASMRRWLLDRPQEYLLIQAASDVTFAHQTGRLAVAFDVEGANAIGEQISLLESYRALGVRWMLLAYNRNNPVGGGCQDEDTGITAFGRDVVREMERLGMLVCLSHAGHRTSREVLAMAQQPVIFSHSNPSALRPHPRNIPDELIRACAHTGGVIGISGIGAFLGDNDSRSQTYARHIDHVVQLVGPEHVSIALDHVFDVDELNAGLASMAHLFPPELGYRAPAAMVAPEQLPEVVAFLLQWGYAEEDLAQILGGNLLRLMRL
jgi:membrane dipeptidase